MSKQNVAKFRLTTKERLSFFTDMSTMLAAGIPILEVMRSLSSGAKGNPKKVLAYLRKTLYNGEPLSNSLRRMPKAFDPVSVNLIRSAEAGGTLETTLRDIVLSTKKEMAFNEELRTTMIYPIFVMGVFLGIVVLMLTFVMPRVATVFESMNVHIPLVTRVMIRASVFFNTHWLEIVGVVIVIVILLGLLIRAYQRFFIRMVFALPVLKKLGTNIDLARFTRSFGLLMRAGVPIIEALDLSVKVVQKKEIIAVVEQMRIDVAAGKPLATNMRNPDSIIPPIMWRSIKTAETSGTFDQTLQNLTEYFDEQVSETLKIIGSLVEPVLILVVGIMVGLLMIAIIAPIYNIISQINSTGS